MWPGDIGLVEIENPWDRANWSNPDGYWLNPAYWSVKHYSYYIRPGYTRVQADSTSSDILSSAYLSPDGNRLVAVYINRNKDAPVSVTLDSGKFSYGVSSIYQSTELTHFEAKGEVSGGELNLPAGSLTTVVLDRDVTVGSATNPSPLNGADGVLLNAALTWEPGSNAVEYAVYIGTDSNAVASATTASPEYQGMVSTNRFVASTQPATTYFWRVDGVTYSNKGEGPTWSFRTESAELSDPWMTQDIGSGIAGNALFSGGTFFVDGSGADIWNSSDAFRYVYTEMAGDCSIVARVTGVENTDVWAKGGVMIRKSLAADSANALICVTPGNGVSFQWRSTDGATCGNSSTSGLSAPYWVKLVRSGNSFTAYRSSNGTSWAQQGSAQTISMGNTVYAGLAVTAHNSSLLSSVSFDSVSGFVRSLPQAPEGLKAAVVSATQIDLSWSASADAESYNVMRSTTSGVSYDTLISNVVAVTYSDTENLNAGTRYYYVVSAANAGGESAASDEASAVPSAAIDAAEYQISGGVLGGTNLSLSVSDSVLGHEYQIWTTESLPDADWRPFGETLPGSGTNLLFNLPVDAEMTNQFFKVDVQRQ
jgi:hypothetical protein